MVKSKLLLIVLILISTSLFAQTAIKGNKIYTMAGEPITNGVILINNGKIEKVGKQSEINIPDNYKLIEGKIVTPGLIDAHSVVGLAGIYNQKHDQDQLELSEAIQPELRAIDGFNPNEQLITWLAEHGVTTINTGHAPGALASGQTMIVKTDGKTNSTILNPHYAIAFSLGSEVSGQLKKPGSRPKGIAMLRDAFTKAQNYLAKKESGDVGYNIRNEALGKVLSKEMKALITANTTTDILSAIRLAEEFDFSLVLDGAAEAYLVLDQIKRANINVFIHPLMAREKNISYETPKLLTASKIPFAIQSGYESYVPKTRNVLFEAAIALSNGLTFEQALASITTSPAKILEIDDRVGSIEVGKDADLVLFDGDPFEYTTKACKVLIDGKVISSECK